MKFISRLLIALLISSSVYASPYNPEATPPVEINKPTIQCEAYVNDFIETLTGNGFYLIRTEESNSGGFDKIRAFADRADSMLFVLISEDACLIDVYIARKK